MWRQGGLRAHRLHFNALNFGQSLIFLDLLQLELSQNAPLVPDRLPIGLVDLLSVFLEDDGHARVPVVPRQELPLVESDLGVSIEDNGCELAHELSSLLLLFGLELRVADLDDLRVHVTLDRFDLFRVENLVAASVALAS